MVAARRRAFWQNASRAFTQVFEPSVRQHATSRVTHLRRILHSFEPRSSRSAATFASHPRQLRSCALRGCAACRDRRIRTNGISAPLPRLRRRAPRDSVRKSHAANGLRGSGVMRLPRVRPVRRVPRFPAPTPRPGSPSRRNEAGAQRNQPHASRSFNIYAAPRPTVRQGRGEGVPRYRARRRQSLDRSNDATLSETWRGTLTSVRSAIERGHR
jgi:hypothetical protein